jgi:hypothetical protein
LQPEPGPSQPRVLLNIFNKNSDFQLVADRLAKKAKAEGTLNNYNCLKRKFEWFCAENSYDFHNFSEQAVLHFVLKLDADNVPYALLGQVKPALALLERLAGRKESVFSPLVDTYLEVAKRRAAEARKPVKKVPVVPPDALQLLMRKFVEPHKQAGMKPDLAVVRKLLRITVERFTLCRFSCFNQLRVCDVEDRGDSIKLTFIAAKNDQMHNGSCSFIVNEEVVSFIWYAFDQLGFKLGDSENKAFLNCVIKRVKKKQVVVGHRRVGYSHATLLLRKILSEVGIEAKGVTDKSFKMQGVTTIIDSGASLEDVMHHGRWRTLLMPLHYRVNSEKYKKEVAKNV